MITAVDTNVLLDVFLSDPRFGQASGKHLREALRLGAIVACEAVWAETAAASGSAWWRIFSSAPMPQFNATAYSPATGDFTGTSSTG